MNVETFKSLVSQAHAQPDCGCNKTNFQCWAAWRTKTRDLDSTLWGKKRLEANMPAGQLENLGPFDHQEQAIKANGYTSYLPNGLNYWSPKAPIAVYFYPYHDCDIYQCKGCQAIFLEYMEESGHIPEKRLRWVRPELITARQ